MEELTGGQSSFQFSLNDLCFFNYAKNLQTVLQNFMAEDYDCRAWNIIIIPAHIQLEGYGAPHYTNTTYPWDGHEVITPGEIPARDNPVACYVKYFSAPADWKNFFISFQGAESGIAVWLNSKFVGYSENSFTPSDFDLRRTLGRAKINWKYKFSDLQAEVGFKIKTFSDSAELTITPTAI